MPPVVDYSIQTVFTNLINNAIDAMKNCGTLNIKTQVSSHDHRMAEIVISDTGIGISDDDIDNIFDPFFTTKSCSEGTGLGLAICHEIIKRSNGTISVKSKHGAGATFTISVPFKNSKKGK